MEQLTPELERRLQVEELWARRNVLCDAMNARRRERFYAQHAHMTQFGTMPKAADAAAEAAVEAPIVPAPVVELVAAPALPAPQPMKEPVSKPPRRRAWLIAVPAMAAAIILAVALAPMKLGLPSAAALIMPASAPPARTAAAALHPAPAARPDLKAEIAAEIANAMAQKQHSAQALQALQSLDSREAPAKAAQ